jgi:hypothetical protein
MLSLPPEAKVLAMFAPPFTSPTYRRFLLLSIAAMVCFGRHTATRLLCTVRCLLDGHPSSYHRVLSRARWDCWALGRILAGAVLARIPADQPVRVPLDDTTDGPHRGKKVYGKGCWRDAVRSSQTRFTTKWGHKWVTLAINVWLPFCSRPWALPILIVLARKRTLDRNEKRRHKTPAELGRQLLAVLIHWFPQRKFIALGDWGFGSHDLALFCHRHRRHVTLVARCRSDLNLYAAPAKSARRGQRKGRNPRAPGTSDDASLDGEVGPARRALPAGPVQRGEPDLRQPGGKGRPRHGAADARLHQARADVLRRVVPGAAAGVVEGDSATCPPGGRCRSTAAAIPRLSAGEAGGGGVGGSVISRICLAGASKKCKSRGSVL